MCNIIVFVDGFISGILYLVSSGMMVCVCGVLWVRKRVIMFWLISVLVLVVVSLGLNLLLSDMKLIFWLLMLLVVFIVLRYICVFWVVFLMLVVIWLEWLVVWLMVMFVRVLLFKLVVVVRVVNSKWLVSW